MAGYSSDAAAEAYRKAQIDFVSNNDGTTPRETVLLLLPSIASLYLVLTTSILVGKYLNNVTRYIYEFSLIILPSILCFTSHVDEKLKFLSGMLAISSLNFLIIVLTTDSSERAKNRANKSPNDKLCPSLTNFRALTSLLTAICILAVDFRVFPRRLAKTEIYGYSLMDTGVGFFVLSNALVSREARAVDDSREWGAPKILLKKIVKSFSHSLRDCLPLMALGFARYFSVEFMAYQRHVTEYGIHWNFFATLAFVKLFTSLVSSLVTPRLSLFLGISIVSIYEYFLSSTRFGDWVLHGSRDDFLSANREGIASTFGYVGLYFIGVALGRLIHSTYRRDDREKSRFNYFTVKTFGGGSIEVQYTATMILCVKLSVITSQACVATRFLESYFGVSRKLANSGYCAWMTTLTAVLITVLILLDVLADILRQLSSSPKNKDDKDEGDKDIEMISSTPIILNAVNYNGLAFFLTCNFFTGAINIAVKTLYVNDFNAVIIITAYMIVSTSLFVLLYRYKIQLKI